MIGDGRRGRDTRGWLMRPVTLLVGTVALAAAGGVGVSSVVSGGSTPGGVLVQGQPSLVDYQASSDDHGADDGDEGLHFTISGNAAHRLNPGATSNIDLVFTNTTGQGITVPAGAVKITMSTPAGSSCSASANFAVVQTLTKGITIPKHVAGDSLADMGVPTSSWPVISMLTTDVTQDACIGVTVTLHYLAAASAGGGHDDGD